jgi:hypothetical protein
MPPWHHAAFAEGEGRMARFVKVQGSFAQGVYRLNIDQIVSYVAEDDGARRTNVTLATGGAVTVELSPEELDRVIAAAD